MIILAVLLLTFFNSVKSENTTHDAGAFHEIAKKNCVPTNETEHESQLNRQRRSVIGHYETAKCYEQFFIKGLPPTSFHSDEYTRYICQVHGRTPCFCTKFDVDFGIPFYAGYVVKQGQPLSFGRASRRGLNFRHEPGIPSYEQGSAKMYSNTGDLPCIHKGHLVSAETYSFSKDHIRSTFIYTNVVPQYATFNCGQWANHERMIRDYAEDICSKKSGLLYLLTGISGRRISLTSGMSKKITARAELFDRMPEPPNIVIPNSMWTAGCCVHSVDKHVLASFAVIGNNVPRQEEILMSQVTVETLTDLLGLTDLFPGEPDCSENENYVTLG